MRLLTDHLPFAVRLTTLQILDVADDAELRAEVLEDFASIPGAEDGRSFVRGLVRSDQVARRVDALRDAASELRRIATRMIDRWAEQERSS